MRVPVDLSPGLVSDDTPFAAQATFRTADKVRWNKGKAEVIGGYGRIFQTPMLGACRNVLTWKDNVGVELIAFATNSNLYLYRGGKVADITPPAAQSYVAVPISNAGVGLAANATVSFPAAPSGYTTATANVSVTNGAISSFTFTSYGAYPPGTTLAEPVVNAAVGANSVVFGNVVSQPGYTPGNVDGLTGPGFGFGAFGRGAFGIADTPGLYAAQTWSLSNFGEALLANPRGGGLYIWGLNGVTDLTQEAIPVSQVSAADGYCPTQAAFALVAPQRCIIAFGATQVDGTYNPLCIRISDIDGNINAWLPATSNAADEVILPSGGAIVGARYFGELLAVFTQSGMYSGSYVGSPSQTMRFDPVDGAVGLIGPNAVVVIGQTIFWISPDLQLYSCGEGGSPTRIECPIRADTLANTAPAQYDKIVLSYVAAYDELRIDYPDSRDGLENSRYLTLQLESGAWSQGLMARSAMDRGAPLQWPVGCDTETVDIAYQGPVVDNASAAMALAAIQSAMPGLGGVNVVTEANTAVAAGSPAITSISTGASGWGVRVVGNGGVQRVKFGGLSLTAGQRVSVSYKAQMIVGAAANANVVLANAVDSPSPDLQTSIQLGLSQTTYKHQNLLVTDATDNLFFGLPALANGAVVEVTDIKVEAGSLSTDWTPSPTDPNLYSQYLGFLTSKTYPQLTSIPYFHEQGASADDEDLTWAIETNGFSLDEDQTAMLIRGFIPDFAGQQGNAAVTIYLRMNPQDLEEDVFGPFDIEPGMDRIDLMGTGKIARFKISGSGNPAAIRFGRNVFDVVPAGKR